MKKCSVCGSDNTRQSFYNSSSGLLPSIHSWYRCNECNKRFKSVSNLKVFKSIIGVAGFSLLVTLLISPSTEVSKFNSTGSMVSSKKQPLTNKTGSVTGVTETLNTGSYEGDESYRTGLNLLISYWDAGVARDSEDEKIHSAVELIRSAATSSHPEAQLLMGALHEQGRGVLQDYEQAVSWYQSAAKQGNAFAMTRLGFMAKIGVGLEKNLLDAYVWLNIASARGVSFAETERNKLALDLSKEALGEAQRVSRVVDKDYPYVNFSKPPYPINF